MTVDSTFLSYLKWLDQSKAQYKHRRRRRDIQLDSWVASASAVCIGFKRQQWPTSLWLQHIDYDDDDITSWMYSILRILGTPLLQREIQKWNWGIARQARNTLDCDQSNYSSRIVFSHIAYLLNLATPEVVPFDPPTPKTPQ